MSFILSHKIVKS